MGRKVKNSSSLNSLKTYHGPSTPTHLEPSYVLAKYARSTREDSNALEFSYDGSLIASGSGEKMLLWRHKEDQNSWTKPIAIENESADNIKSVAFSPDCSRIFSLDKHIYIHDINT